MGGTNGRFLKADNTHFYGEEGCTLFFFAKKSTSQASPNQYAQILRSPGNKAPVKQAELHAKGAAFRSRRRRDLLLYVIGTDRAISIDAMCTGFRSHRHGDSTNIGSDRDRQPHIQEAARFSALGRHLSRFLSVVKLKNSVAWIAILNSLY
jgi:hypothetical protein